MNQILKNRYQVEKQLGSGATSEIYKVLDTQTNKHVAIKRLTLAQNDIKQRFIREFRFLQTIDHPSLVKALDYFEQNEETFIVLEYVYGETMEQMLGSPTNKFTLAEQIAIAYRLAQAVELLNGRNILHRDIKPENIMIDPEKGIVKLVDLGVGIDMINDNRLTMEGAVIGTLDYLSPEQTKGEFSFTSDIFSLGVTLYQFFLWREKSPFQADSSYQTMCNIEDIELPSLEKEIQKLYTLEGKELSSSQKQIYASLGKLLIHAMAKKPGNRCPSEKLAKELSFIQKEHKRLEPHLQANYPNVLVSEELNKTLNQFPSPKKIAKPKTARMRRSSKKKQAPKQNNYIWIALSALGVLILLVGVLSPQKSKKKTSKKITSQEKKKTKSKKESKVKKSEQSKQSKQSKQNGPHEWPKELFQQLWNGKWIDFSHVTWQQLSNEKQAKYAGRYQKWYAQKHHKPVEKPVLIAGIKLFLVFIPPGKYWMGASNSDDWSYEGEQPRHKVTFRKGFWMGKTEVTQELWQAVMQNNPSYFKNPQAPVERVTWRECREFCKRANFDLPSEAQWEYACRAGTSARFYWGNTWDRSKLNSASLWAKEDLITQRQWQAKYGSIDNLIQRGGRTKVVASFAPNPFGLYDILGNVWERCDDTSSNGYANAPDDGRAWVNNARRGHRVFRGGGYWTFARFCRSSDRRMDVSHYRGPHIGLRIVKNIGKTKRAAVKDFPRGAVEYYREGIQYIQSKNAGQALLCFNKAIKINPKFAEAYERRGYTLWQQKRFDQAIASHTKAISIKPKFVLAYFNRGFIYQYNKNNLKTAITDYDKVLLLQPKYLIAYYHRGLSYQQLQNFDSAINDYIKAIELAQKTGKKQILVIVLKRLAQIGPKAKKAIPLLQKLSNIPEIKQLVARALARIK